VLQIGERVSTPSPSTISTFRLIVESIKELAGASYGVNQLIKQMILKVLKLAYHFI